MRKEVGYAIFAGVLLGIVVAFGVSRINSNVEKNKTPPPAANNSPSPTPTNTQELKIVIDKPSQNEVFTEDSLEIVGLSKADTFVVINLGEDDYLFKTDSSGSFKGTVTLAAGINELKITAIDNAGSKATTPLTAVFSSEFEEKGADPAPDTEATGSSGISSEVAKNIARSVNQPKAYIGTITDISGANLEIKTDSQEIKQITLDAAKTSAVNLLGTTPKQVKTTDIAIGDFIAALGYMGANSVLETTRVLITEPVDKIKSEVLMGTVTSLTKKSFEVTTIENKIETVTPDAKKTSFKSFKDGKVASSRFSSLEVDDQVIYVTTTDEKGVKLIRSVFVIKKAETAAQI